MLQSDQPFLLRNTSDLEAHNVQVQPITLGNRTAFFDRVEPLGNHGNPHNVTLVKVKSVNSKETYSTGFASFLEAGWAEVIEQHNKDRDAGIGVPTDPVALQEDVHFGWGLGKYTCPVIVRYQDPSGQWYETEYALTWRKILDHVSVTSDFVQHRLAK
jgi:hypothetical protein